MIHGFQLFMQLIPFISLHNWVLGTTHLPKLYCCIAAKVSDLLVYLSALVHYFLSKKSSPFFHAMEKYYVSLSSKVALLGKLM